ncbi:MAG TPA: aminotransferase class V-fold PLP-dependent enzyme [Burkholderiales bacterium]|nr:aminotransferase class V-fold PLP-dependent enzyme [Burkholderiales bacterium]
MSNPGTSVAGERAPIDLAAVRAETPGCQAFIHFNNAGASLPPRPVTDAILQYTAREALAGGYELAETAAADIESTYDAIAELLGAQRHQIALVENATRAWDMAFYGIPLAEGDRILTCRSEYASNYLAYLHARRRCGVRIDVIPDTQAGDLDIEAAARMMDRDVKLISITHVPTSSGLVNPARALGQLARKAGCYYLLDACQSAGQIPLDVQEIGCDFLSSTGRKFLRGPRGTGFLYASDRALAEIEPPFVDGRAATWISTDTFELRDDARRYENWEFNHATRVGLGVAARYAATIGVGAIWTRVQALARRLRERLSDCPGITVRDRGSTRCAIVTFTCEGHSAGSLSDVVRASVHYYNTEEEVDCVAEALEKSLHPMQ